MNNCRTVKCNNTVNINLYIFYIDPFRFKYFDKSKNRVPMLNILQYPPQPTIKCIVIEVIILKPLENGHLIKP